MVTNPTVFEVFCPQYLCGEWNLPSHRRIVGLPYPQYHIFSACDFCWPCCDATLSIGSAVGGNANILCYFLVCVCTRLGQFPSSVVQNATDAATSRWPIFTLRPSLQAAPHGVLLQPSQSCRCAVETQVGDCVHDTQQA